MPRGGPKCSQARSGHFPEEGPAMFGSGGTGCVWTSCLLPGLIILFPCPPSAKPQICHMSFLSNDHSLKILFYPPPPRPQYLSGLFFFFTQYLFGPFCVVKAVCRLSALKSLTYTFQGKACLSLFFFPFFFLLEEGVSV